MQALEIDTPPPTALEIRSVVLVANRRAGRVLQLGRERFSHLVIEAFARHGVVAQVVLKHSNAMEQALNSALESDADLVVLAGGDGSLSHALPALTQARRPCALLPFGTLNLLGRDLGLKADIAADIASLAASTPRQVSLGRVNMRLFHSIAGFGVLSTMARERENARRAWPFSRVLGYLAALWRTLLTYRPIDVEFESEAGAQTLRADTILVTNNRFEGVPWARRSLNARQLEVHLLAAGGVSARLRLLWLVVRGRWREHPALTSFTCTRFVVKRPRKNSIALAIDGESCRMHGPVVFDVAPQTLTLHA